MRKRISSYELIMIGSWILWITLFGKQLTYPVLLEETDYLRFLKFDSILSSEIWSSKFFYLLDGHPPLLSFTSSLIAHAFDSLLIMRMFILGFSFFSLSYIFRWCKELNLSIPITISFAIILLFSPIHSILLTSAMGDVIGMGLLMGWLFHRSKNEYIRSCLCLFSAAMIRETHILPALIYLIIEILKTKRLNKELLVEIIPGMALGIFFVLSKFFTGELYSFSGKSFLFNETLNIKALLIYVRFILPLIFIVIFTRFKRPRYFWLAVITSIVAMIMFFPYLSVFYKTRLITPFLSVSMIALMFSFQHVSKKWIYIFLIVLGYFEFKFYPSVPKNHPGEAKLISNFIKKIDIQNDEAAISGTWPFNLYFAHPAFGHWKGTTGSRKFIQDFYDRKMSDYPQHIIYMSAHPDKKAMKQFICDKYPDCDFKTYFDKNGKSYEFFFRGYDMNRIRNSWESSL